MSVTAAYMAWGPGRSRATVMAMADDEGTYRARLGAVITELRLARGYRRQVDFAEALGVHESTVQRWEAAKTMPSSWDVRNLSRVLGVGASILLDPPDRLPPDVLAVSQAAEATIRREIVKRTNRKGRRGG